LRLVFAAAALALLASPARADPCDAISNRGPAPAWMRVGATFSGHVTHVVDGEGLCVRDPRGVVEVRLADFSAPERAEPGGERARQALTSAAYGRSASCRMGQRPQRLPGAPTTALWLAARSTAATWPTRCGRGSDKAATDTALIAEWMWAVLFSVGARLRSA